MREQQALADDGRQQAVPLGSLTAFSDPRWDGARNAADFGGLPLVGGGRTVHGRVWRSAAREWMTTAGWRAARAAGLACIIDLRNDAECGRRPAHPTVDDDLVGAVPVVSAPTEDPDDPEFLAECGPWLDRPRAWAPNMRRYPEKLARAFTAIADAEGPVLIHCAGGRDRTGMVGSMLLALAGVEPAAIAANYEDGFRRAGAHRWHGLAYDAGTGEWIETSRREWSQVELDEAVAARIPELMEWLEGTNVASYLLDAGMDAARLAHLSRMLKD